MKLLTEIPYFKQYDITEAFRARITPNMTDDEKTALQAEYQATLKTEEKAVELKAKAVAKANQEAFLANPKAVLEEIQNQGRTFSTGEMLLLYGIATVTSKRFGKGDKRLKGSDFSYTASNFKVTVTIGNHTKVSECSSSNDRRAKESMHAMFASQLAQEIVNKSA